MEEDCNKCNYTKGAAPDRHVLNMSKERFDLFKVGKGAGLNPSSVTTNEDLTNTFVAGPPTRLIYKKEMECCE